MSSKHTWYYSFGVYVGYAWIYACCEGARVKSDGPSKLILSTTSRQEGTIECHNLSHCVTSWLSDIFLLISYPLPGCQTVITCKAMCIQICHVCSTFQALFFLSGLSKALMCLLRPCGMFLGRLMVLIGLVDCTCKRLRLAPGASIAYG